MAFGVPYQPGFAPGYYPMGQQMPSAMPDQLAQLPAGGVSAAANSAADRAYYLGAGRRRSQSVYGGGREQRAADGQRKQYILH